ncbi:hypothetical protein PLESTB_000352000 [Pleodorina starrii]|uniref:Uncharacterized protein n=1 Tax=Pleodorina starrii TaxID=330485 RepID=A0A9W6EYW7_9CHLO|nr:hypothetical protein PLESTM_000043200 [Pleodorina starrii]GLC50187.1 hypothetical protein PLESTB_000352000 [Pleodorina starrii]GLC73035.1 hypothetical protein PLESTF_001324600 [Pleodorina starrii]
MRMDRVQGTLPSVSEGRRALSPSARHPQPGGRGPSSDGASCIPISTAAAATPGTALPAGGSGPYRSPSRRVVQPLSSAPASYHAQQQSTSGDGDGSFNHAGAAATNNGCTTPTTCDPLASHNISTIEAALFGATTFSPAAAPPSRPMDCGPICGPLSDDRPPLPASAAPPLGAAPPAVATSGRGRRNLPSMGISVGPMGRPGGARRSLSPNPMEQQQQQQQAAVRTAGAGLACPQMSGTAGTASACYRTGLVEAPNAPGGPMQPRPPLQVPAPWLLDDPSVPSLHPGAALLSPRLMRLQLLPSAPMHALGGPRTTPSISRQGMGTDEFPERSSAPEMFRSDHSMQDSSTIAPLGTAAAEGPPPVGGVGGDAKQVAMLNDLAAAVGELQRRVAEMTPRPPHDSREVSDAGSGYSWCTSTRSSAPGTAVTAGDSGSLGCAFGVGPWAPPPGGTGVSASGGAAAMDERLALLEAQMKHLAAAVFDAAPTAAGTAPSPPPPPAAEESAPAATDCGGGGPAAAAAPNEVRPPAFWSEPGEAVAAGRYGSNAAPPKFDVLAGCATVMYLALGFAGAAAVQIHTATDRRGGGGGAAAAPSAAARRKLSPAVGLFGAAAPGSRTSEATATAAAAMGLVQSLERRLESLTERLSAVERTASAAAKYDSGAVAAAAAAATAAAAGTKYEEARQRQVHEQQQREVRAAVAEAVAATAQRQEQLEARVRACEEQAQRQQQMLATGACAVGADGAANGAPGKAEEAAAAARADEVELGAAAPPPPPRDDEFEFLSNRLLEAERAITELAEEVRQAGGSAAAVPSALGADAFVPAAPPAADWQHGLAALTHQVQNIALQVTSARAQSSSVAAEVQVVLEQVRDAQATAAAAFASARQASAAATAAERSAAAALDVVDAAAAAARATGGGRARRCRSSSGGVAADGGTAAARRGAAGGLRSPRRSEVWLAGPQAAVLGTAPAAVAARPLVAAFSDYNRQQQEGEGEDDDSDNGDEAELMSVPAADAPPPRPPQAALPGRRRLAARDVGFRILPDGADVTIGGGGATLYGISASRTSALEAALTRLAEVEASLQDLRSKLGRGLSLRVTHDELRESVAQMDLKLRTLLAGIGGGAAGAGLCSRSASLAASIGFRGFSAAARLGGGGDGASGGEPAAAAAASGGGDRGDDAAAEDGAAARGGGRTAAADRQPGAGAWVQGRRMVGGGGGRPSDSVSNRGGGLAWQGNVSAVLAHLQRSVGILEQRLEEMEGGVAQYGTLAERVAAVAEPPPQQLPPPPPQQQRQQALADRPSLTVHSHSGSVARRCGGAGGGSGSAGGAVLLGLDEQLAQLAHRIEADVGAQGEMGRVARGMGEQPQATGLVGGQSSRGVRELARSGRRGGPARDG